MYTLASIVDDIDMGITHVVRGSDHTTNTATQIQIITALGHDVPQFAHHSLLVSAHGEALSKRNQTGMSALRDLRDAGIEPMALLSLMARTGSSQPVVLFSGLKDLAEHFDLSSFGNAPTKFDIDAVYPLNTRYLQTQPLAHVADRIAQIGVPDTLADDFWLTLRANIRTLNDLSQWWDLMVNGAQPIIDDEDRDFIAKAMTLFPKGAVDTTTWGHWTQTVKDQTGRKGRSLFMPLRKALTGQAHGPDMAQLLPLLQVIPGVNRPMT